MRESDLLSHIYRRSVGLGPRVILGPGDDCALVSTGPRTLLTIDHLIEDRHFKGPVGTETPVDLVARKAVARSVSDIAAMAGTPAWALATAALPAAFPQTLADELFDRMAHWAKHFGCPLVGGDIASTSPVGGAPGPVVLTVTIGGDEHPRRGAITRAGARPGDRLYVTGRIGDSFKSGRHLTFEPRVREAAWLADALGDQLHAMIDLSDGLGRDAGRVADASGVRIEIDAARVPLHGTDRESALADGEDYELAFTVDPSATLPPACLATGTPLTLVGRVIAGSGCVVVDAHGHARDASAQGWDH